MDWQRVHVDITAHGADSADERGGREKIGAYFAATANFSNSSCSRYTPLLFSAVFIGSPT